MSGGGIAAANWTVMCLDKLEEGFPAFPYHVRVVTGASGGMVGAACYVAELPNQHIESNPDGRRRERQRIMEHLARDSLTPVVRQMVLVDLPSIFLPIRSERDRGGELEQVWERN